MQCNRARIAGRGLSLHEAEPGAEVAPADPSPMVATMALAIMGPMPGTVISRWQASSLSPHVGPGHCFTDGLGISGIVLQAPGVQQDWLNTPLVNALRLQSNARTMGYPSD